MGRVCFQTHSGSWQKPFTGVCRTEGQELLLAVGCRPPLCPGGHPQFPAIHGQFTTQQLTFSSPGGHSLFASSKTGWFVCVHVCVHYDNHGIDVLSLLPYSWLGATHRSLQHLRGGDYPKG